MKNVFVMVMAILMVFCLVACGGSAEGTNTEIDRTDIAKTATFEIKNIDVYKPHGASTKIAFGLYCDELDKAIAIYGSSLTNYINFYGQYSEGDIVKVTWKEDKSGTVIESSLIFEKVSNELVPIKEVGEP